MAGNFMARSFSSLGWFTIVGKARLTSALTHPLFSPTGDDLCVPRSSTLVREANAHLRYENDTRGNIQTDPTVLTGTRGWTPNVFSCTREAHVDMLDVHHPHRPQPTFATAEPASCFS